MSRPSPILVGVALLAIPLIGGELYLLLRSGPERAAEPLPLERDEPAPALASAPPPAHTALPPRHHAPAPPEPTAAGAPVPPPPPEPAPPPPPPVPAVFTEYARAAAAGNPDGGFNAAKMSPEALRMRDQLMASHQAKQRRLADEQVFDMMKMPDSTREAIRKINDDAAKKVETFLQSRTDDTTSSDQIAASHTVSDEAFKARQEALQVLLGTDGVKAFQDNEFTSERRSRRENRRDLRKELDGAQAQAAAAPAPGAAPAATPPATPPATTGAAAPAPVPGDTTATPPDK